MDKKYLKKLINDKGFFVNADDVQMIQFNELEELLSNKADNAIRTSATMPKKADNILVFRGVITQQFKAGEVNRNGYKIDINGWDWKNYKKNPQILLQHDSNNPIGKALSIIKNETNIELIYFVNLDWVEGDADKARVAEGGFPAMSTGSIVKEYVFENKETGERISKEEYYKLPYSEWKNYDFVVTKSEGVENSVVAIGSNPDALTVKEALEIFFNKHAMPNQKELDALENEKKENEIAEGKVKEVEKNETIETSHEGKEVEKNENEGGEEGTDEGAGKTDESENDESGDDKSDETEEKTSENDESEEKDESENDSDDSKDEKSEEESEEKTEEESDSDDSKEKDDKAEDFVLPKEAKEAVQAIVDNNAKLVKENAEKDVKINELQKTLDNTPNRKVRVVNQFDNVAGDKKKNTATNGIDCLKNMGVKVHGQ